MIFKQITYLRKDDRLQHIMQEKKEISQLSCVQLIFSCVVIRMTLIETGVTVDVVDIAIMTQVILGGLVDVMPSVLSLSVPGITL